MIATIQFLNLAFSKESNNLSRTPSSSLTSILIPWKGSVAGWILPFDIFLASSSEISFALVNGLLFTISDATFLYSLTSPHSLKTLSSSSCEYVFTTVAASKAWFWFILISKVSLSKPKPRSSLSSCKDETPISANTPLIS